MQYALSSVRTQSIARSDESKSDEGEGNMAESSTISQEWLAQAVVTESAEAIVVTDADGTIRLWNGGAARIFGYSAADALGQSLDLIIPEKLRGRHWKGYEKTMATGITRYGDTLLSVPASHQDGRRLSIEFSVALLRDEAGTIVGISAIMREVSERREADRVLRIRIAALEQVERTLRARVSDLEACAVPRPTIAVQGYPEPPSTTNTIDS
jgi:PAS domain S-box-containing protein